MFTGSKDTASSISLLLRLRLRAKVANMIKIAKPMMPTIAKTTPERTLFCKKDVCDGLAVALGVVVGESGKAVTV
jgi:hypothetical protein